MVLGMKNIMFMVEEENANGGGEYGVSDSY